jgi:hypothetical protein
LLKTVVKISLLTIYSNRFINSNYFDKEWGMTRKNISSLAITVLVGLILQIGLIFTECTDTPSKTAVSFVEAYYRLCPSMAEWLCDESAADDYLYEAAANAGERGFSKKLAKYSLSHIEAQTEYIDDTTAIVHLTAHRRLAINPLYAWVAWLFQMGKTYDVDEHFEVKLKDGQWRISESSLPLIKTS